MTRKENFIKDVNYFIAYLDKFVEKHPDFVYLKQIKSCVKTMDLDCRYSKRITKNVLRSVLFCLRSSRHFFSKSGHEVYAVEIENFSNMFENKYI